MLKINHENGLTVIAIDGKIDSENAPSKFSKLSTIQSVLNCTNVSLYFGPYSTMFIFGTFPKFLKPALDDATAPPNRDQKAP